MILGMARHEYVLIWYMSIICLGTIRHVPWVPHEPLPFLCHQIHHDLRIAVSLHLLRTAWEDLWALVPEVW